MLRITEHLISVVQIFFFNVIVVPCVQDISVFIDESRRDIDLKRPGVTTI